MSRCVRAGLLAGFMAVAAFGFAQTGFRVGVLRGPTAIAFAPLMETGATLHDGRPLEIKLYPEPSNLITAFISGEVDAATLPSNAAAQLYGRGIAVEIGATFIWGVLYVVGPGEETLSSLKSPVHSIGRGATPDIVLRYVLDRAGLADQVRVAYGYAQVELAQLLIAGRVSAGVLPEPFVTRVLRENPDLGIIADLQSEFRAYAGSELPQTVLILRPGSAATESLVAALDHSVRTILAEPNRIAAVVAGLGIGLDEATALESLPRLNLRVVGAAASREALETYFAILYAFEPAAVGGRLPAGGFYGE